MTHKHKPLQTHYDIGFQNGLVLGVVWTSAIWSVVGGVIYFIVSWQ